MKPVPIGPFAGVNNRLPDHQLGRYVQGKKAGDWLRNAVNVDVSDVGTLTRRAGTTQTQAGADCHSLWSDGTTGYYVDGATLYRYPRTAIREHLTPGLRASFCAVNGVAHWSNGAVLEKIVGGVSSPVGIPVPNPAPIVTASSDGALPAGVYQVAITATNAAGEESGATWPAQVTVPEGGALHIAGLPVGANLYVSPANGDMFFYAETVSGTSTTIALSPAGGRQLLTLGLRQMPAGHIVRHYNGRLLVAAGNVLYYSEPFAYGLTNPVRDYIPFVDRITVVEPCENGVFVVAGQTYWLEGGDIEGAKPIHRLPYGAAEGSGGSSPVDLLAWWFSDRGLVFGYPDGSVKNLQEDAVVVEKAPQGASLYREQDGLRQVVSTLSHAEASKAAASSFIDAEIVRQEHMQ